tara:strand:+ start:884 stop:1333 length:450 start_codon:yes stop_codon:yes gene_type:complete
MIQATRNNSTSQTANFIRLNLYDKMTSSTIYNPLISITSQLTGKTKSFASGFTDTSNKDRFISMLYNITNDGTEGLAGGIVSLGDSNFPYGFYDVTIFQNTSNINVDPSGLTTIFTGLLNFKAVNNNAVNYTEYTTNDSDTESVYITNN